MLLAIHQYRSDPRLILADTHSVSRVMARPDLIGIRTPPNPDHFLDPGYSSGTRWD